MRHALLLLAAATMACASNDASEATDAPSETNVDTSIDARTSDVSVDVNVDSARETSADAITIDADFSWDPLPLVEASKIVGGTFDGGFLVAPAGYLNWYFANLGLRGFVARIPNEVKTYLELYLAHLEPDLTIQDVTFTDPYHPESSPFTKKPEDSDDSYAATFLSLVVRWERVTKDRAWWDAHVATLKSIADANLLASQQSNGLVHVFQSLSKDPVFYTEDNCEAYGGLKDFADFLGEIGDADAGKYADAATKIAAAIDTQMFLPSDEAFSSLWEAGHTDAIGTKFYPDAVTQAFPQAYDVPLSSGRADAAYAYLGAHADLWWTGKYDASPFMLLGWTAALRGDATHALAQQAHFRDLTKTTPSAVSIHDLGFYQRITLFLRDGIKS